MKTAYKISVYQMQMQMHLQMYLLILQTLFYTLWQYIRYLLGRPRLDCVKNIAFFISQKNILYSKILQTLATSANFLTIDELDYLSHFNDSAPYSPEEIYSIEEILDNINLNAKSLHENELTLHSYLPENSGIIALVYYGTLDDKEIVLKVKRCNIEEKLKDGINHFERILYYCKYLPYINKLNIDVIFQENKEDLLRQVDFENEVNVMRTFKHKYRNTSYISIPLAYPEYTSMNKDIIVMEKLSGHKLHDKDFRYNEELKSKFGLLLAKYSVKTMLYNRLYHGDLHAGNIFFNDDDPENLKLCIIDFGIVGEISKAYQKHFYSFFTNVVMEEQMLEAAKVCLEHFTTPKEIVLNMNPADKERLLDEMLNIITIIFDSECQFDTKIICMINKILYNYGITLNRNFCRIQLSLAVSCCVCNELCKSGYKYIDYLKLATKEIMDSSYSFFEIE